MTRDGAGNRDGRRERAAIVDHVLLRARVEIISFAMREHLQRGDERDAAHAVLGGTSPDDRRPRTSSELRRPLRL
jgi:hypothetical protein